MTNPWLAIDVATAPITRAREMRRAWERFVVGSGGQQGDSGDTFVRAPIADSWRRSAAAGVDPSGLRIAPQVADADEASARWEIHPLAEMAPLIRSCLAATADESQHLIVVSDANGVLLWVEGNATVRLRAADSMNFAEGTLWSEGGAGTNAIGTAIAAKHAVQVFASEHFNEIVQCWTCAAAPVHDPCIPTRWRSPRRRRRRSRRSCAARCSIATRGCSRATAIGSAPAPDRGPWSHRAVA